MLLLLKLSVNSGLVKLKSATLFVLLLNFLSVRVEAVVRLLLLTLKVHSVLIAFAQLLKDSVSMEMTLLKTLQ